MTQNRIEDPPGLVLGGRYRLGPLIGRGGMAAVHEARDEALDRAVAIKLFRTDLTDPDELARQETEAKLLARLNHPNLVTVFDAGTDTISDGPQTYLVMELVHGTDLRRALHNGSMRSGDVARVGAGVAAALEYIHRSGVIHRDVKPANILMNDNDGSRARANPKLTDFGIARLVDGARLTATGESLGTAMYFSPEQASGGAIGPACDIYALGLVLLECLTGTTAFPGPAVASAAARLYRNPDIPNTLGPQWQQLLRAMTQRNPEDRPAAAEAADALRTIDHGKPGGPNAGGAGADTAGGDTEESHTASSDAVLPAAADAKAAEPWDVPTAAMSAVGTPTNGARVRIAGGPGPGTTVPGVDAPTELQGTSAPGAPQRTSAPAGPQQGGANGQTGRPLLEVPGQDSGGGARGWRAGGRRRKLILSVVAALVLAVIAVVLIVALGTGADAPPMQYPSVPGQLGEHLQQLQESVEP